MTIITDAVHVLSHDTGLIGTVVKCFGGGGKHSTTLSCRYDTFHCVPAQMIVCCIVTVTLGVEVLDTSDVIFSPCVRR